MSRSTSSSVSARVPGQATVIAIIACLVLASPASARFGNPLKKVKEKLEKSTEQKATPQASANEQVVFDDVTVELTDARVQNILATFKKAGEVGAGRPALVEKRNKAAEELDKHREKNEAAIAALKEKRSEVESCLQDEYRVARNRRTEEYQKRALTDPALREKFMRAAQQDNAAAARGDSAAIQRLQTTLESEILPTREDSLQIKQKCGTPPPPSAAEERLEALNKGVASLDEQIRATDEKVAEAQAKEGGLTREQWGMALERIQMYLASTKSGKSGSKSAPPAPRGFTEDELKVLEKYVEQLRGFIS